ncbi:phospholipase A2 [Streptomyces sp. NPDC006512]|uniref:phospholipase A2 n=1 Tax=Streptomyces sp. NPDC006512 TaxID=3154307 RepID=UPI0033A7ED90
MPAARRRPARIAVWSLVGALAGGLGWATALGTGSDGPEARSDTVAVAAASGENAPALALETIVAAGKAVYALSADHQGVYEWSSDRANWLKVRGATKNLYAGGDGVYATDQATGDITKYDGEPGRWTRIGDPGHAFVATTTHVSGDKSFDRLFGISPDRSGVWEHTGKGDAAWTRIGEQAASLYTIPAEKVSLTGIKAVQDLEKRRKKGTLFATDPVTGDIRKYDDKPGQWTTIGGPGAAFAVTDENLYGLTPDGGAVVEYDVDRKKWNPVGGPAGTILASNTLYSTNRETGDLYKYNGRPGLWNRVSGPAAAFVTTGDLLYRLAPDKRSVQTYSGDGSNDKWRDLRAPAAPATREEKLARLDSLVQPGDAAFNDWARALGAHRTGEPDRYEFDWTTNKCNEPAPNMISDFDFTLACIRHDFGYRNYKDLQGEDTFKHGPDWNAPKDRVDRIFQQDLHTICNAVTFPRNHTAAERKICRETADAYFAAVVAAG